MNKLILVALILSVSGCASKKWEPVIDPRASAEPREVIRDTLECERLIQKSDEYGGVPLNERSDCTFFGLRNCWNNCGGKLKSVFGAAKLPDTYNPMASCMAGRKHSIINWK